MATGSFVISNSTSSPTSTQWIVSVLGGNEVYHHIIDDACDAANGGGQSSLWTASDNTDETRFNITGCDTSFGDLARCAAHTRISHLGRGEGTGGGGGGRGRGSCVSALYTLDTATMILTLLPLTTPPLFVAASSRILVNRGGIRSSTHSERICGVTMQSTILSPCSGVPFKAYNELCADLAPIKHS